MYVRTQLNQFNSKLGSSIFLLRLEINYSPCYLLYSTPSGRVVGGCFALVPNATGMDDLVSLHGKGRWLYMVRLAAVVDGGENGHG